ncbi:MAG: hypothetical protein WCQ50_22785, partial [Spirochaetota bacterium]
MYISESWNLFNQWGGAPTGATNNWDSLSFTVGGHQYTVGTPNPNARVIINGDYAYPLFNSAGYTVDTTTLSNGNYEVVATLGDTSQQHNGTPARVITIPFTVNNTVVPVDLPTLTLTAPTSISFNQTLDPYTGHALDVRSIIQIKGTYLDGKPVTLAMDGMPLNSVGFFTISAPTMTNGACSSVFIFNADGVTLGNYTLTLTATCGTVVKTANISLGVSNSSGTVGTKPTITSFVANPLSLISGNSGTLTPVFVNGTLAEIDNGVGTVTSGQIVTVGPLTGSKTYTLTVYNSAGSVSQQATFSVSGLPVITAFMAQPQSLLMNNDNYSSLFAWYSGGIGTVDWGLGEISGEGAPLTAGWLTDSRTYTLTVTNSVGSVTRQTTISNGTVPIIFSFQSGSPTNSIASGTSTTITPMFSQGGDGPWGEGFIEGIGVVANAEPINTGVLTANKTYKLKVTNAWGYVEQSLTITMNAPAPPPGPTITSFGPADLTIGSGGSVTLT